MNNYIITEIRKLFNQAEGLVPLHAPTFIGNEKKYLEECVNSTFVSSVGKFVDLFEHEIANYTGAKKAVACVNGTNALQIALNLVGVKQNDEVITQALTFVATCNAISYIGAEPVFIDVDRNTMGLSPNALKKWLHTNAKIRNGECFNKITGKRIKCCLPMHTFGHPVRIIEIADLCNEFHIELVEDAAESIGSYYKNKHTGTFGKVGAISFNGNKTITTGGGGMLLFNDEELAAKAKHITTQAKVSHRWDFVHDQVGYNFRMPNINAALGCAQLENLDKFIENKRELALEYENIFTNLEQIQFFKEPADSKSNYWLQAIILPDKNSQIAFLEFTNDNGIMTRPIWELMNRLPMFKNCQSDGLKNTIWFADRVVNIPSSVRL